MVGGTGDRHRNPDEDSILPKASCLSLKFYMEYSFLTRNVYEPASGIVSAGVVPPDFESPETFAMAREWLAECPETTPIVLVIRLWIFKQSS